MQKTKIKNEQVVHPHMINQIKKQGANRMDFTVTHEHPVLTPEEKEKIKKEIIMNLYYYIQSKEKDCNKSKTDDKIVQKKNTKRSA